MVRSPVSERHCKLQFSLLVLTSKHLTLCEEMQKQEAIGMVKCGNDPVVSAGASEVCVG